MKSDLEVNVAITEARTSDSTNAKILSEMAVYLKSIGTSILLNPPILIRPEFLYSICVKGFPKKYCCKSFGLMSSVTLNASTQIEFHNDNVVDGKYLGLVHALDFNNI